MSGTDDYKADILVVDDQLINLKFLTTTLSRHGYRVRPAINGELALETAKKIPPDLILLDIMMPKMDGFEVCEELKRHPQTRDIPVIFVSALHEARDKVKAFSTGGVDYITKPFEVTEVMARVKTHLALRSMQKQLEAKNTELQGEIAERTRIEAELKAYQDHLEELVEARTTELVTANEQLQREVAERKKTEDALQESQYFLQSTLDALSAHIAILNEQGTICAVNESWRRFGEQNGLRWPDAGVGRNYLEVVDAACDNDQVSEVATALRGMIAQTRLHFWTSYACHSNGQKRWFNMRVSCFEGESGMRIVVSHENITEQKLAEETLRESENMLRTIINATQDAIIAIDHRGLITLYNAAAEKIFGFRQSEMIGHPLDGIIPEEFRVDHHKYLESYFSTGKPARIIGKIVEFPALRSNGQTFPMEVALAAGKHDDKKLIVGVARDITQRRQAEEERQRREQFLALLNDMTRATLETSDLQTILQTLANKLGRLYSADCVYFTLWNEHKQTSRAVVAFGDQEFLALESQPEEMSLTRSVLMAGRPLVTKSAKQSPFMSSRLAELLPDYSIMCLPLIAGEQKLGAVIIGFSELHTFSADEITHAEQIARHIALAVAKTKLLEETHTRWREAETLRKATAAITESLSMDERLDVILEQLDRVVPYDSASVQMLRDDCMEILNGRGFPSPDAVIGLKFPIDGDNVNALVVKGKKPVILNDVREKYEHWFVTPHDHIKSWLGIPLIVQDRLIGMLTVDSVERDHFTHEHVRLVTPFANQVAAALENAHLYERARQDARVKAALLSEVNHRVKNNLSAIIGLLYAERRHAGLKDDAIYQSIMTGLISRIRGLSIVHNLLSESEWSPLNLSEMTRQLIDVALQLMPRHKRAVVKITPSAVEVTSKQANNLALVINELATNTIKHALKDKKLVHIDVTIEADEDLITIAYRDDGPGFPDEVLQLNQQSLGLYLIQTLVRSGMRGEFDLFNENGAVAIVRFHAADQGEI